MLKDLGSRYGRLEKLINLKVCIPSPRWTDEMEFVLNECKLADVDIVWIKHGTIEIVPPQSVRVINFTGAAMHAEDFFYRSIIEIEDDCWILRVDNDEILGSNTLLEMKKSVRSLSENTIYGIPRIWLKKIKNEWFKSLRTKANDSNYDYQYRLFNLKSVKEDRRIHTPGVIAKKKKAFKDLQPLIHVIWEVSNLEERILKIQSYENIEEGAGIGKIRYYLPELYPQNVGWERLNEPELEVVKRWSDVKRNSGK
jgi:hypothetical protein